MIPVSLKVQNFTSYGVGVPTLDFRSFHLAVLTGRNGAGKSSLLDAITWCVWGTSRAGDSSDALVKQGQINMQVEFEFDLDGQIFKVLRSRSLKSSGLTRLDFYSGQKNLTEGTIKATQEKIINTLHLTYETFTNSSFLRQGNADEFTVKGATDRKRILAEILDLKRYDGLEEKAKEIAKDLGIKIEGLNYSIIEIDKDLDLKENYAQDLSSIEKELKETETQEKLADSELKEIRAQGEVLSQKVAQAEKSQERLASLEEELKSLTSQKEAKEISVKDFQAILALEEVITKNDLILVDLKQKAKDWQVKQTELNRFQQELVELKTEEGVRNSKLSIVETQRLEIVDRGKKLKEQLEGADKEGANCPTCGQKLGQDSKDHVRKEIGEKLAIEKENYQKIAAQKIDVEKLLKEIQDKIPPLEEKIANFKKEFAEFEGIQKKIDELADNDFKKAQLTEAKAKIDTENKALTELTNLLTARQTSFAKEKEELKDFEIYQSQLIDFRNKYQEKENNLNSIREILNEKRTKLGSAQKLVERSTQMEKLKEEKLKEKQTLSSQKTDYEELALAFGKKGIQAMIIENAIPEIETEANNLLNKLTDGRMSVEFLTQKEAKTGATIETLDIIISDENGARSYEMYSGGEAFRVNFAIRLALSKLLTHRAGAKLQFLVIDEGFGTQDTEGRDRLVEAINLIKGDYTKILVVTHVEELKEAFPNQIFVTKGPTGSTFQVIG